MMEEYDDGYYATMKAASQRLRDEHMEGRRHIFEAEMKQRWRTPALPARRRVPTRFTTQCADRGESAGVPVAHIGTA